MFQITDPRDHAKGHTVYRVTSSLFPVGCPEACTTITTWKRFSEIQALHKILSHVHQSLYLHGTFPQLPKTSYFNRKDSHVIEERRAASLEFLEFSAHHPPLYNNQAFVNFFSKDEEFDNASECSSSSGDRVPLGGQRRNSSASLNSSSLLAVAPADIPKSRTTGSFSQEVFNPKSRTTGSFSQEVVIREDLSIDSTPVLLPTTSTIPVMENKPSALESKPSELESKPSELESKPSETVTPEMEKTPTVMMESDQQKATDSNDIKIPSKEESEANLLSLVSEMPVYVTEAAEEISKAISFEADEMYEESISHYRSAIGKLLGFVQSDPDPDRQSTVKRRIAQYITKAEELVRREAETRQRKLPKKSTGIPHLELFGQMTELKQYRIINIIDRVMVATHAVTNQTVVIKTLNKSTAVYKKSKTSLLPINITHMVKLLKYFETDDAVYLLLEYCNAGRLWDVVKPLVDQLDTPPRQSVQVNVEDTGNEKGLGTKSPVRRTTSIIRPSPSFIRARSESVNFSKSSSESDLSETGVDDINYVFSGKASNSLVVVEDNNILHYDCPNDSNENVFVEDVLDETAVEVLVDTTKLDQVTVGSEDSNKTSKNEILLNSQKMLDNISNALRSSDSEAKSVLDRLDNIESKIKRHLKGETEVLDEQKATTSETVCDDSKSDFKSENFDASQASAQENVPESSSPEAIILPPPLPSPRPPLSRPRVLRKLSELLPRCPTPQLSDSTQLPDTLIRIWAAELAQVISSLHYRDIVIRDLHPANVLLDERGHLKLTYQCEWVSVDRGLATAAVEGNYCSPETLMVSDVTPAADWWSYGAILYLLYTGRSPSSNIPSGIDSTIPIDFPEQVSDDARDFITSLLKVLPENRLGAGSFGSNDVRNHDYFRGFNWDAMSF